MDTRKILRSVAFGLALALSPAWQAAAATPAEMDALVAGADTPEEHLALAAQYREQAAEAHERAERHRKMGEHYGGSKRAAMKRHCDKLAELNDAEASEYEALAKAHEEEAAAEE